MYLVVVKKYFQLNVFDGQMDKQIDDWYLKKPHY